MPEVSNLSVTASRRLLIVGLLVSLALVAATALTVSATAFANPYNCTGEYSCQFANTGYGGQRDYYAKGYNNFAYATSNSSTCISRNHTNWNDCARSTFNSHLSVTVGWFYNSGCTGAQLNNTPSSGSSDLQHTYAGNFYEKLSSVEYFGTPAEC